MNVGTKFSLGSVLTAHAGRNLCSLEEAVSFASRVQTILNKSWTETFLESARGKTCSITSMVAIAKRVRILVYYSQPLPLLPLHMARCSWTRCLPSPAALCKADLAWSRGPSTMLLVQGIVGKEWHHHLQKGSDNIIVLRGFQRHLKPSNMMVVRPKLRNLLFDYVFWAIEPPKKQFDHHRYQNLLANICWDMFKFFASKKINNVSPANLLSTWVMGAHGPGKCPGNNQQLG